MSHSSKDSVINFYKFVRLERLEAIRADHLAECLRLDLRGTILLAPEGINVGLAGAKENLEAYLDFATADQRLGALPPAKWTRIDAELAPTSGEPYPFRKMECRIKNSIVTFAGAADPSPEAIAMGRRMTAAEAQTFIEESVGSKLDDVIIVDTRNDYEADWGTFRNAVTLPIKKFSDFPAEFSRRFVADKDKTILFFCTGGIRCEKVVPWAIAAGWSKATQIDGGILAYLEHVREAGVTNQFNGSCFVFDQRWALDRNLIDTAAEPIVASPIQPKPGRL